MDFLPIKTRPFLPPKDDLFGLLDESLHELQEGDIVFVTSKIVSIHDGRCVPITDFVHKDDLIIHESEKYIPRKECPGEHVILTIKRHTMIPSSGIDESNARGHYILWPKDPQKSAYEIYQYLKKRFGVINLAVIITDSHSLPLRAGTLGISIGFYGLKPCKEYRGKPDIFGRELKVTRVDIVDSLAAAAVYMMGEGMECTPICIGRGIPDIEFIDSDCYQELLIDEKDDMYYPIIKVFQEKKK